MSEQDLNSAISNPENKKKTSFKELDLIKEIKDLKYEKQLETQNGLLAKNVICNPKKAYYVLTEEQASSFSVLDWLSLTNENYVPSDFYPLKNIYIAGKDNKARTEVKMQENRLSFQPLGNEEKLAVLQAKVIGDENIDKVLKVLQSFHHDNPKYSFEVDASLAEVSAGKIQDLSAFERPIWIALHAGLDKGQTISRFIQKLEKTFIDNGIVVSPLNPNKQISPSFSYVPMASASLNARRTHYVLDQIHDSFTSNLKHTPREIDLKTLKLLAARKKGRSNGE